MDNRVIDIKFTECSVMFELIMLVLSIKYFLSSGRCFVLSIASALFILLNLVICNGTRSLIIR